MTGITATVGAANVYAGDERVGATVRRAYEDARALGRGALTAHGEAGDPSGARCGRRTSRTSETSAIQAGKT